MAENKQIKYSYQNKNLSLAAVSHSFRYLSAVTGIGFIEDIRAPEIFSNASDSFPENVRILITKNDNGQFRTQIKAPESGNWLPVLDYDPIEALSIKLSLKGKSGPLSHKQTTPSGPGQRSLSGIITDFQHLLYRAGILKDQSRGVSLWSEPARFAMAITHDIDIPRRSVAGGIRLLLNRQLPGGFGALIDSLKSTIGLRPNPYDTIAQWNKLESELGITSTYFIFDGLRRNPFDPKYKPEMLFGTFEKMGDLGIALHTSVECFDGDGIAQAKSRLEQAFHSRLCGLRPHYLSAFYPNYWRAASEAGFTYSSSLGFDRDIGFWDRIDLPFYPFDAAKDTGIPILEIPIAMMDCGVIGNSSPDSEQVLERAMRLIDQTAATGGLIVLDWHPRTFYNRDYPGWSELFTKIVRYGKGKGAGFYRLNELAAIFEKRFRA
jgi:hypothetical protein